MCYSALVKRDLDYLGKTFGAVAVREQVDDYQLRCSADPRRFPPLRSRIYPGHYAPVIHEQDGKRVIELMRYGAFAPEHILNPSQYTTYNARSDNLRSPFWSGAFMQHHGFVVLERFYEWVAVKDLLTAGVVSLAQIEAELRRHSEERKAKILAQGKKWKATPTEQKPVAERLVIIEFRPKDASDLIAPVIFSYDSTSDDAGFAIVTAEPPVEIEEAGHDRCPVVLDREVVSRWLTVADHAAQHFSDLLKQRRSVVFEHQLAVS
jgi:putative SOS response-associated peptidase YedK